MIDGDDAAVAGPHFLRLVDTVTVVTEPDGLRLLQGNRALRIKGPSAVLRRVVDALRAGVREHVLRAVPERATLRRVAAELESMGWLTNDPTRPEMRPTVERQLGYLTVFGPDAVRMQRRMETTRVAVLGVGGVGTVLAQHLVGAGVRALWLVDFDQVAPHNLNRQFLFGYDDIGDAKTTAGAHALRRLAPDLDVRTVDVRVRAVADLDSLPDDLDLLAVAADTPRDIVDISWRWARSHGTSMTTAAVGLETGYWGPLLVPASGHCWTCFERTRTSTLGADEATVERNGRQPTPYSFGPSNTAVSALLAHDVLQYLATGGCPTLNRRAHLNLSDGRIAFLDGARCTCTDEHSPSDAASVDGQALNQEIGR